MAKFIIEGFFNAEKYLNSAGAARRVLEFCKDQIIFAQGDPSQFVCYLRQGAVKLTLTSESGKEVIIALVAAGAFFGEGCLVGQALRNSTATALGHSVVLQIAKKEITRVIHEEHQFSDRFVAYLLRRNVRVEEDLADQLFNSTEKRLARTLLLISNYGLDKKGKTSIVKMSHETLAEMVGTTRSNVSVFMSKFRKLGYIKYNGGLHIDKSLSRVVLKH